MSESRVSERVFRRWTSGSSGSEAGSEFGGWWSVVVRSFCWQDWWVAKMFAVVVGGVGGGAGGG